MIDKIANPNICSDCPKRGKLSTELAKKVLGEGYAAPNCKEGGPVLDVTQQGLYELGWADSPLLCGEVLLNHDPTKLNTGNPLRDEFANQQRSRVETTNTEII